MPGRIEHVGSKWILHWGDRTYEHSTKAKALRQMRALYANEPDATKELLIEKAAMAVNLPSIGLDPLAVTLVQPLGKEKLYVQVAPSAPDSASGAILKLLRSALAPTEILSLNELSGEQADLLMARPIYKLALTPSKHSSTVITTKKVVSNHWASAALASKVFKADRQPRIPFRIVKADPGAITAYERIVTGVVLEPNVIDGTKTIEDGEIVAEGDTYTGDEIRKAMYWWMEFGGRAFSYHHVELGGRVLSPEDVVVLENWQVRAAYKESTQDIPVETWMLSARVNYLPLWNDIISGAVNSWSIGARAMGQIIELPEEDS